MLKNAREMRDIALHEREINKLKENIEERINAFRTNFSTVVDIDSCKDTVINAVIEWLESLDYKVEIRSSPGMFEGDEYRYLHIEW